MNTEETSAKEEKLRTSRTAAISIIIAIPVLYATYLSLDFIFYSCTPMVFWCLTGVLAFASLILATLSLFKIRRSNGRLRGRAYAVVAIVMVICSVVLFLVPCGRGCILTYGSKCRSNSHQLRIALELYCLENDGKYPLADNWCDSIKDYLGSEDDFVCPARKGIGERCSYAINPYCKPDSPPDTVLLFETNDGWNQHGSQEIVSTENHCESHWFWGYKMPGCIIVFNGEHPKFVLKKRLSELRWKAEDSNNLQK